MFPQDYSICSGLKVSSPFYKHSSPPQKKKEKKRKLNGTIVEIHILKGLILLMLLSAYGAILFVDRPHSGLKLLLMLLNSFFFFSLIVNGKNFSLLA